MKKTHYPIGYYGNKRAEVERIYNAIKDDLNNIKYIVEPFCGTSALSYYISTKHPKQFTYVLNDNNKFLCELNSILKDDAKTNDLINKLNELKEKAVNKEEYDKIDMNENIYNWVFKNKYFKIRPGLYPLNKKASDDIFNNIKKFDFVNFIKNENIVISNIDGLELYKQYKDNNKSFIFLDPPYLLSCNDFYGSPHLGIYEYLSCNDINKEKAKILLCLNDNWIIKMLFKNNKKITYDKIYQTTKKIKTHIIITNKNIKSI
jgi:hypothetical protein